MGFIQKDALRTTILSFFGLLLGYVNKGVLFIYILKTEEIGLINLILSVGILFGQLSNLGSINSISKFLPFFLESDKQKRSFLRVNLIFVSIGVLIFSSIAFLLHDNIVHFYDEKSSLFVDYYYWIVPIGIANVFFYVFETYLRSMHKNLLSVFMYDFVLRLFTTVLLFLLIFKIIYFPLFFILICLSYFIPSLVLFIYLIKIDEIRFQKEPFKISKKFKKIIFSYSLFSYSNSIAALSVMTMDSLMIAYYIGLKETGVYTTIIFLISALQVPYKSLTRVSNPLIPIYWKEKNMAKMSLLYKKISSISLIISLYMFLVIWVNRDNLFTFLPSEYLAGIWVFFFLMIGRINDMYFGLNTTILITSKKYKYDIIFTFSLLLIVFILNYWLIPIYGIIGAAISTSFAIIVNNIGRLLVVLKWFKIHPFEIYQLYVFVLFFSILFLSQFLNILHLNKYVQISINLFLITSIYFGVILKFKWNLDLNIYLNNIYIKLFNKKKEDNLLDV